MPSDLTELFDRLRREPLGTPLAGPEALRQEGTRRRRVRRAVTAGLAAGAVAVVAVTLTAILPTPLGLVPPPPPGLDGSTTPTTPEPTRTSSSPTPTSTGTPTTEPTATAGPIPDTAFPSHSAVGFANTGAETGTATLLPEVCGLVSTDVDGVRDLADTTDLAAIRLESSMIDVADPPDQLAPEGTMAVQIMLYSDGGAARFVESLRGAVATCRTDPDARWGPITFTALTDAPVYGDETFAFVAAFETQDHPSLAPYICEDLYEVVRVGDAVMVAAVGGWETCHTEPELDRELRDAAIEAFVTWAMTV